ncbi:MAG TPA: UDP-N-acetylmuramyl pentapeptide phosphotransferase [Desulfobacteraceae bacterium]|nr:UDP-N-acetylmuramyl pentapeptide phosphotransferase [Desulfobacteraceae bacterium]
MIPPWIALTASLVLGAGGAWAVCRWGHVLGLIDVPTARSSHRRATPKGGGIGIAAGIGLSAAAVGLPTVFWGPVLGISLVGLAADRFDIGPGARLAAAFVLAGIVLAGLDLSVGGAPWPVTAVFLAVFLVGTANFFNFMDGINGIAGLSGITAFVLLAWHGIFTGADPAMNWLALGAAVACGGFLPFNLPRARVFMGDTGSLTLGFLFAALAAAGARDFFDLVCRAAFLLPFYLDEFSTMALRLRDGEPLSRPHRRHLYQLLANEMGIAHWKVALGYAAAQMAVGLGVLRMVTRGPLAVIVFLAACTIGFAAVSFRVRLAVEGKVDL